MKIINGSNCYFPMMTVWIIINYCSNICIDAKGFRMRTGGGINPPRSNVVPHTGLFPRTGMMPFFIPVVIPIGMSRTRNYNQRNGGLQCYACEGTDNDICVINPASTTAGLRRLTCPLNQYCSVVRKEVYLKTVVGNVNTPRPVERIDNLVSAVNKNVFTTTFSSSGLVEINGHDSTTANHIKTSTTTQTSQLPIGNENDHHVFISRGCRSPEYIQQQHAIITSNSDKTLNSERITKTYTQFCVTDYCNFGDGRLKCYECEGEGNNHPCMVNPESVASVITCQPNYYCNVIWTINNTISVNSTLNKTSNAKVTISRGCKAAAFIPINEDDDDDNSPLAMACSSDLCNSVDGNQMALLYVRSGVTGFHPLAFYRISMLSLLVYLIQKN